jgi:sugar phosphate isomerase/epimerase
MPTRTGGFPIGFRRGGGEWQRDLGVLAQWAKENEFEAIDLGKVTAEDAQTLQNAGLKLGSVDLPTSGLLDNDAGVRREAIERAVGYVKEATGVGAKAFFLVIIPDASLKRSEAYTRAVESYAPIASALAEANASLAIEGYPGGSPHMPALCCTPESCRRFISDLGGKGVGLNYDPSHLIRLGVDHIRFLNEFAPYVRHVHGKDTEILSEAVYEYGLYQPAVFAKSHGWGEHVWRYTLPGHGCARWTEISRILQSSGFNGIVSVELEDENFNGSEAGEKAGFLHSLHFLRGI